MAPQKTSVAVIGAGPYGLSLCAHLSERGCSPLVFGRPMESWRFGAPPSMRLKSEGFASSLSDPRREFTLKSFCRAQGLDYADVDLPIPIGTFVAYGEAFQKRFAKQLDTRLVHEVRESREGFELDLDDGTRIIANQCVVATGLTGFEHIPSVLSQLGAPRLSHTSQLCDYAVFSGARVLVVGAGASATNAAAELLRHGAEVTLTCRDELRFYGGPRPRRWTDAFLSPPSPIGPGWSKWAASRFPGIFRALPESVRVGIVETTLGPAPAWFVREEIEGRIAVLAGRQILDTREKGEGVEIDMADDGGARVTYAFDFVIAGSGYRVSVDRLNFLSLAMRARLARVGGAPRLSRNFESSIPGLYFLGVSAAYHFGPALRFVCGADFAARRVSAAIVASLSNQGVQTRKACEALGAAGLDALSGR